MMPSPPFKKMKIVPSSSSSLSFSLSLLALLSALPSLKMCEGFSCSFRPTLTHTRTHTHDPASVSTSIKSLVTQHVTSSSTSSSTSLSSSPSNDDYDDPEYLRYRPQSRAPAQGGLWAYTEPNIRRAAETFQSIRSVGGSPCTNDMYARSISHPSQSFQYWYIGKVARTDGTVSLHQAVSVMWNMMEEHACRLRPIELGREFGTGRLELWAAPGDSELEMSQALASSSAAGSGSEYGSSAYHLQKMNRHSTEGTEHVTVKEVGFMAEFVTNSGQGFYIVRDDEGRLMQ